MEKSMTCTARPAPAGLEPAVNWEDSFWQPAETLELGNFRPEGSSHRPRTRARLLYDTAGIHGFFHVEDRFVRCIRTGYFDEVWKDSCVEFFAQPVPGRGYLNFEFNCGGAFLCSHILDPERTADGFKQITKLPASIGQRIRVQTSLPQRVDPEVTEPVAWTLSFSIPLAVFEHCLGRIGALRGQVWRGNFYKCADECSHPHWASWSPVDRLDFHRPDCFGMIRFE